MAINQFAKISPIINSEGYLLDLNSDGTVVEPLSTTLNKKLKANEIGIIYKENILATMYGSGENAKLIRLGIAVYDEEMINNLVSSNDGNLDGKLVVIKRINNNKVAYDIKIIKDKEIIDPIQNIMHTGYFVVNDKVNSYSDSYIGMIPYKLMRITLRIKSNITKTDGSQFVGDIVIYAKDYNNNKIEITRFNYNDIDITHDSQTIHHDIFECETIFKDYFGSIEVATTSEGNDIVVKTIGKNIEVCVEYNLDNLSNVSI